MPRPVQLAMVLLAGLLLLPGLASAADGVLSVRMSDGQRLLVYLDGEEVGKTPLDLTLSPGRYDLEAKVTEYSSKSVLGTVVVRSGQNTAAVGYWGRLGGVFREDVGATRGTIEVTLSLASAVSESLPESLGAELWPQLRTAATCGEEELAASAVKVTQIEGAPLSRLITVKSVPPGTCRLRVSLFGAEATFGVSVKAQKTSAGAAVLKLNWAVVRIARLGGGDRAELLRRDDEGKEQRISLSTKPLLVASGPGKVVLQHSGKKFEIADLADVSGSVSVDPYGLLVFPEAVQVDAIELTVNRKKLKFNSRLLLPVGVWKVGLSAPGTHPVERTVAIRSGRRFIWSGTLSQVTPARVAVAVAGPAQWQLSLNGKKSEASGVLELLPGKYNFEVSAQGWAGESKELELTEGQEASLSFELSANPVPVRFRGLVSGSKVTLTAEGGEPTEMAASGEHQVELPVGRYRWKVSAQDRSTAEGSFELKPADSAQDIAVELPWTELALVQSSTRVRTAVLAGVAGALAGTGIAFVADGQGLYSLATEQHDEYLSLSDPDDILWAKSLRDDSIALGQTYEGVGWALVGVAAGAGAAAAISAVIGGKKASELSAALVPTQEGAVFALTGRW